MIDTIVFDLILNEESSKILPYLVHPKKGAWTEFATVAPPMVDVVTGEVSGASVAAGDFIKNQSNNFSRNFRLYNDSDLFVPVLHAQNINVPSWNYDVNVHVDTRRARFSFSIPKYLYGTNVFVFRPFDNSIKELHILLLKFLVKFFQRFPVSIALSDIEFRQIDLCYNQFFVSEKDALTYLEAQKKIVEQKSRINAKGYTIYKTSFQYLTQYYNFKVYHKGSEFKLHDAPRLQKLGKGKFVEHLQGYADKILRYEMSFKHSAFNMLFREYFFKGNQKHTSNGLNIHVERFANVARLLTPGKWDEFMSRTRRFTLNKSLDLITDAYTLSGMDDFYFSPVFLQLMQHYFVEKMHDYEINGLPSLPVFVERIETFNKKADLLKKVGNKGIRTNQRTSLRLILAFMYLKDGHKFNELRNFAPETTIKDLKQDLKELGINAGSVDCEISSPGYGYHLYELMCNFLNVQSFYL